MTRRLGKGLGSLLGDPQPSTETGSELELADIRPNPFQPRAMFDPTALEELRDSIQRHGVLQPVVVRKAEHGYELVSGERRWRAAKQAGLQRIPASVRPEVSDADMLELALVENVQRKDLDPIERARGFKALMGNLSLTQQGVADRVGLKRTTVANHLRLLELPAKVQEAVGAGLLSMGHARALLGLGSASAMVAAVGKIVRGDLSVREVERLVRDRAAKKPKSAAASPEPQEPWAVELQRRFQETLGTKVSLQDRDGQRGKIVIEYFTREELDRLCERLAPRETL